MLTLPRELRSIRPVTFAVPVLTKQLLGVDYIRELYESVYLHLLHLAYYSVKHIKALKAIKALEPPEETLEPLKALEPPEETIKPLKAPEALEPPKEALKYRLLMAILCLNTALNARQLYNPASYHLLNGIWSRNLTPTWRQLQWKRVRGVKSDGLI
jgi:hypothetical protein